MGILVFWLFFFGDLEAWGRGGQGEVKGTLDGGMGAIFVFSPFGDFGGRWLRVKEFGWGWDGGFVGRVGVLWGGWGFLEVISARCAVLRGMKGSWGRGHGFLYRIDRISGLTRFQTGSGED